MKNYLNDNPQNKKIFTLLLIIKMFRSNSMKYYNLIISRESAWEVLNQLGDLEALHFVDYDPSLPIINRPFANYIKRYFNIYKFSFIDVIAH